MGLQRVNTAYFEVVNTSDPDVSGSDGHGENEWVAVSDAIVGPDATRLRIRALTRREIDGVPFGEDGKLLGMLVDLLLVKGDPVGRLRVLRQRGARLVRAR